MPVRNPQLVPPQAGSPAAAVPSWQPVASAEFPVRPEAAEVAAARRAVARIVRGWRVPLPDERLADLELLAGEVVSNAVRHSDAGCTVAVRWDGTVVRVEVTDASTALPVRSESAPDAEDGRGLLLVQALATGWGTAPLAGGKAVWFEVGPAHPEQPPPWSTPGTSAITTADGSVTAGYLPAWAEDDPTEVGVPPEELPQRLAFVNHRAFFEGPTVPVTAPDIWDGAEDDAVFEGSIDCTPYATDPRLRIPVVNLQISVGRWILGLDPHGLAEIATRLRDHADMLDRRIRPALVAARDDWAARSPQ
ncbi:ATP-binding protein [Actinacidiphila bryophytorum]|uniref:ATP-binding protein n=1 Tax=Actinacidiphila bryophytorum TaxID=1436133 RepID=UPI002176A6E9|nr:ATP-binding protein [Actinacidiphila bryophytorum]UWE13024.1 ATP-binding protein [Actinacidiphila bryophytorum]